MGKGLTSVDPASQAAGAAQAAADRAGIRVVRLDRMDVIDQAATLFNTVWAVSDDQPLISPSTLRALSHSENYVYAAFTGSEMLGAIVGFIGYHTGALQLHSHMLGVSIASQGKSVGYALKQHQRAWALGKGIGVVTWTFDPLVRRNAFFNITKLGASVISYYPSFYGQMHDGINGTDESDRVLIEWQLDSPRATEASVTSIGEPDLEDLERSGAGLALGIAENGTPEPGPITADTLLVRVPQDIVDLRGREEDAAGEWRLALRNTLGAALNDGYSTTGMTRSGFYVLKRDSD